MIVLVSGMFRSGSTFAFNVVREVLQTQGTVYQEPTDDLLGAIQRSKGTDHVIVKAHYLDPTAPTIPLLRHDCFRLIFTSRRIEDAVASWFEAFPEIPEETAWHMMRSAIQFSREAGQFGLRVPYDMINRRPLRAAWRIARYVWPSVSPLTVARIANRYSKRKVQRYAETLSATQESVVNLGWSHYCNETFVHRRHVSQHSDEPAERRLPPA